MKTNILVKTVTLLLVIFVFLLPGCRNYLTAEMGALSLKRDRIDFPKDGVK